MAKSNLYLLQFNQYYNRIVKRFDNLEDYMDYVVYSTEQYDLSHSAFNPNDGVNTKHIVNTPDSNYDYLLVVNPENNEIESRWFVTEAIYQRGNGIRVPAQYAISLHRDLMADFFEAVTNATTFIEKARIVSTANPLIYNSEGFQCNQIKTSEKLLKDVTKTPWIVCYFDKKGPVEEANRNISTTTQSEQADFEYSMSDLQGILNHKIYGAIQGKVSVTAKGNFTRSGLMGSTYTYEVGSNNTHYSLPYESMNVLFTDKEVNYPESFIKSFAEQWSRYFEETGIDASYKQKFYEYANVTKNSSLIYTLISMNGKVIKDTNSDTYFRITLDTNQNDNLKVELPVNSGLYDSSATALTSCGGILRSGTNGFAMNANIYSAVVTKIEVVSGASVSMTLGTTDSRIKTEDAPYDIFCMPYGSVAYGLRDDQETKYTEEYITANVAQKISTVCGAFLYDIQLLPYCPCMNYWNYSNRRFDVNATGMKEHTQLEVIRNDKDGIVSFGFWCKNANFNAEIAEFYHIPAPKDPIEFKIANECDKYRLVSPNYNGAFEFTLTKNNGLYGFEVNCTYKPLQPYIHVNPIFSGLYGKDFNDERGLVCGGDFSLPRVNDEWVNYQIQNKAYRESFERQITNMETNYQINREHSKTAGTINALTAAISGAGSGAVMGMTSGGAAGAATGSVIGGTVSGTLSFYGLQQDLKYAEMLQNEALSYSKDMFNYNLQNIQALPNILSRISAFDINSKLYPFLEYYTCTDVEKQALRNKLIYNGMTVMTIGTIGEYLQRDPIFIQGQLIRINLNDDYHIVAEIASEIHRGIYI